MGKLNTEVIPFTKDRITELKSMDYNNYPVLYILHSNSKKLKAYIGGTVQIRNSQLNITSEGIALKSSNRIVRKKVLIIKSSIEF